MLEGARKVRDPIRENGGRKGPVPESQVEENLPETQEIKEYKALTKVPIFS